MPKTEQFPLIFERLKAILQVHEPNLRVLVDREGKYELIGMYSQKIKKDIWYGKVEIGKNYVSFHLMPVYMFPDLLKGISEDLRKHMQGKGCFNFTHIDDGLFEEMEGLTMRSIERVRSSGELG
jgi:hypothetical protein